MEKNITIDSLIGKSLSSKSLHTVEHMERVALLVRKTYPYAVSAFGLDPSCSEDYAVSALLHDIGKITIDSSILNGSGALSSVEREEMKGHCEFGAGILSQRDKRGPNDLYYDCTMYHHEQWDGLGYPFGLKAREIPFVARFVSVLDYFDALTSERPYKEAKSREETLAIIVREKGRIFDPLLVDFFVGMYEQKII